MRICDSTVVWEAPKWCGCLMEGKTPLHLFITTVAFLRGWCCLWLPWKKKKVRKKWPLGGLKLLLKALRDWSRCHWSQEDFPHWLYGGKAPGHWANWCTETEPQSCLRCCDAQKAVNREVSLPSCKAVTFAEMQGKGQTAALGGAQTDVYA